MSKDEQLYNDIKEIKECLIGNKLKSINGLVNDVQDLDRKVSSVENRIHTLEKKRKYKFPTILLKLFGLS